MALSDFRYVMRFRVPFHDIDMMQHVNNASYVVWSETIRCNYFEEVLGGCLNGVNGVIIARIEMNYEQSIDYREDVAIGCRVGRIGRKSFDCYHEIWNETRNVLAARGVATLVAYDYEAKTSIAIPEQWREIINAYESVAPTLA